jgi:hypothetical protein
MLQNQCTVINVLQINVILCVKAYNFPKVHIVNILLLFWHHKYLLLSCYLFITYVILGPPSTPKAGENGNITNYVPKELPPLPITPQTNSLPKKTTAVPEDDDFTR